MMSILKLHSGGAAVAGAFAVALLLGASAAQAATVIQDPAGNATGILGLDVDGTLYDVEFLWGVGGSFWGSPLDWTFLNQGAAVAAVDAVAGILAAESTPVATVGPASDMSGFFYVPYDVFGASARIVRGNGDGAGAWTSDSAGDLVSYSLPPSNSWTRFTGPTPVEAQTWGRVKSLYR